MSRRPSTSSGSRSSLFLLGCLTAIAVWAFSAASPAFGESSWFHLTSGTRPAYLNVDAGLPAQPAVPGVDEVQELVKEETAFSFFIVSPTLTQEEIVHGVFEEGPTKGFQIGETSTAKEVEEGLEGLTGYGAGSVNVQESSAKHYKVTFVGPLAERPVALMRGGYENVGKIQQLTEGASPVPPSEPTDGELYVTAENVGDANTKTTVKLTDAIPAGLRAVGVAGTEPYREGDFERREPIPCTLEGSPGAQTASCTLSKALAPYDQIEMRIAVKLNGGHSGELNQLSVSGGGAPAVSIKRPITISSAPVPFGVESYEMGLEEEGGASTTQAGAHPFQLTTTIALNQLNDINPLVTEFNRPEVTPPALAKDLSFRLPAGLIGNATVMPQCTTAQFYQTYEGKENKCPPDTAVGVATATVHEPATVGTSTLTLPIFNLEPREGEPARFGFYAVLANSPVSIDTSVRNGSDYGVVVSVNNITQTAAFLSSEVTFWGVPGDPRHNKQRGWGCLYEARGGVVNQPCTPSEETHPKPFLSLPTSCDRQLQSSVQGDSWSDPGNFFSFPGAFEPSQALIGCNRLPFAPQLNLKAEEAREASHPTGMSIDVHVPQEANENAAGLTSSNIRSLSVTFPAGVSVNPSSADGLKACSEAEVGYLNARGAEEELLFSPTLPEPFCPDAAKIGTAKITTPLLAQPVEGGIYLATPAPNGEGGKNPFNTLVSLYMVLKDPISGVLLKLPGSVSLDQSTGQITSSFQNTPDLSFEDAEVNLFGGPRAPLGSPARCGSYPISASFTPWSGGTPVTSSASFSVTSGPNGSPCPAASLPFSPSLAAGTANINAGAFSPISTSINREDGNQPLGSVALHLPPGLSGVLTGVTLCPEEQANTGACPQNSLIGESTVSAGFGSNPFTVHGGQVFLTAGYKGAPFGLSILTPAIAGPFNLGNVVVRAKLEVDPHTAALTATTNEAGQPYSIPHILDGIPLDIRHVNVTINRANFTFNPTSCNPQSITGTVTGTEGAAAAVSSPFQAASCQNLKFAPKFAVSTSGKYTKANGTSLKVKLTYPTGPLGTYANLAKVKVSLPKQLPSRLTTLNKACVSAVFEANPLNCPKESIVGKAKVLTPLLPVPLEGSAYFVSHASESFPDLTIVLKGYGITIDLVGNTQIKKGITTTTFKSTPDVPFSSFELNLPAQPYSALTANTNICKSGTKLSMPTEFQAQSGGTPINQSTPIAITGCAKPPTRAQQLSKALKACHKKKSKAKRKGCEAQAHKRYGPVKKAKKGSKASK
jgi:hypothetical protein